MELTTFIETLHNNIQGINGWEILLRCYLIGVAVVILLIISQFVTSFICNKIIHKKCPNFVKWDLIPLVMILLSVIIMIIGFIYLVKYIYYWIV